MASTTPGAQDSAASSRPVRPLCSGIRKWWYVINKIAEEYLLVSREGWLTLRQLMSQKRTTFDGDEESDNYISMEGKTVIITGGTTGVGLATAKELVRRKARVILGLRHTERADNAPQRVYLETDHYVHVYHLDLGSFESIWDFAAEVLSTETRLDVLINAAAMVPDCCIKDTTVDDNERCIQTNYIGPVLLTTLLLDLLKKSTPSRVVNVSCNLHRLGSAKGVLDLLRDSKRNFAHPGLTYYHSKLAMVLFTDFLARELRDTGVTVNTADPGVLKDGSCVSYPGIQGALIRFFKRRCGKTEKESAQTCVYLAIDPSVASVTGQYYTDCTQHELPISATDSLCMKKIYELTLRLSNAEEATRLLLN